MKKNSYPNHFNTLSLLIIHFSVKIHTVNIDFIDSTIHQERKPFKQISLWVCILDYHSSSSTTVIYWELGIFHVYGLCSAVH
jgi:hypothetical protein